MLLLVLTQQGKKRKRKEILTQRMQKISSEGFLAVQLVGQLEEFRDQKLKESQEQGEKSVFSERQTCQNLDNSAQSREQLGGYLPPTPLDLLLPWHNPTGSQLFRVMCDTVVGLNESESRVRRTVEIEGCRSKGRKSKVTYTPQRAKHTCVTAKLISLYHLP